MKPVAIPTGPLLLTLDEAAEYAGISRRTLDRWIADRLLTPFKLGHIVRVRRMDIETLINREIAAQAFALAERVQRARKLRAIVRQPKRRSA